MKESVLDVLMYLCNRYLDDDIEADSDEDDLHDELVQAGFPGQEISRALDWLESLSTQTEMPAMLPGAEVSRVYTAEEAERLNVECRGFLLFLEQVGAIDGPTREIVIERVMALGSEEIELEQLKWVVLMVMFNQPGQDMVQPWVEELLFEHDAGVLH